MLAKSDVIIRYKCYLWKRLKSVFRQNSELVGGDARARVFVSSRLSIVGSTGITTSKLHKRSDSPSQAKEWNLTELFDTISANPCECHRRLQGWKKEGNERTMDVKQKGRAVEILLHDLFFQILFAIHLKMLRLWFSFFAYFYIFCPSRFWDLRKLKLSLNFPSKWSIFLMLHGISSNSKLFLSNLFFFFVESTWSLQRIHVNAFATTGRIYTKRWNNPWEIRRKRRRSFLRYLGAFLENRFVRAHRGRMRVLFPRMRKVDSRGTR